MRSVCARRPVAPLRSESELALRPARNCPSLPSDCGEISVNTRHRSSLASVLVCATLLTACAGSPRPTPAATTSTQTTDTYDLIVRNGTLFDGSGTPHRRADVGIRGDRVAWVGDLSGAKAADLADIEKAEIVIIEAYLPKQMDDAAVAIAIKAAIAEAGAASAKDMGKVMAVLKAKHAGQMDFQKASAAVKAALG